MIDFLIDFRNKSINVIVVYDSIHSHEYIFTFGHVCVCVERETLWRDRRRRTAVSIVQVGCKEKCSHSSFSVVEICLK